MKFTLTSLLLLLSPLSTLAQESLCDTYTTALLTNNTGANQYLLLTLIVNTALIGNYTQPNHNKVNGILVPGTFNGKNVTLLPYFNGGLLSTNRGTSGSAVNFIDDGGAIALAQNKPAFGTTSNQFKLISHLYGYFGSLLGCSQIGQSGFPSYAGSTSMYETHKFMDLSPDETGYFIQEVGLSAASFGVSPENVTYVGTALNNTFNQRCSPKVAIPPAAAPQLQAICINSACPTVTSGAVCDSYNSMSGVGVSPATATSTSGPQLTALAGELSSISAGLVTAGAGSTGVVTGESVITSGGSTFTVPVTSTVAASVVSSETTVITSGGSTITAVVPVTEANPATTSVVQTVITSVITSGSSTFTSLITTSVAAPSKTNAGAMPTAAGVGMMAVVGAVGVIGQML